MYVHVHARNKPSFISRCKLYPGTTTVVFQGFGQNKGYRNLPMVIQRYFLSIAFAALKKNLVNFARGHFTVTELGGKLAARSLADNSHK